VVSGAADQQQDLAEHISAPQVFPVHLLLPLLQVGAIGTLGVPSRVLSIAVGLYLGTRLKRAGRLVWRETALS
jgi:hypothetical protein